MRPRRVALLHYGSGFCRALIGEELELAAPGAMSCRQLHAAVILILDGVASATQVSRSRHGAVVAVRRAAPLVHPVVDFGFVLKPPAPQSIVARASH
jgi:hypothetical protein